MPVNPTSRRDVRGARCKRLGCAALALLRRLVDEQDRVRPHMRIFRNGAQALSLDEPTSATDEIHILQALSGG